MTWLPRTARAWCTASIALVPIVLIAAVSSGSLSASAARRSRTSAKKPTADASASTKQPRSRLKKLGDYDPTDETVNLFDAAEAGQIAVKLIPKDSTEGRVFIENKTKRPLNVKLPETFSARPVLAQMGMGMGGGGGQGAGGGMGGMGGMGGGGMGMGGGFFNVPAEKEGNFKVPLTCLEHGKPEPRPAMSYKIEPIEALSKKPGVKALCRMLGYGKINQRAAQVAAWHLNNDMSWEKLASKRIEHADGSSEPYFTLQEMREGIAIANLALSESNDREDEEQKPSPGETAQASETSLSKSR